MPENQHWVGTWTTAPAPAETGAFTNQTLRMTMRASLGGDTVRVRISNAYGRRLLDVGGAHIALRDAGPAIVPGSDRELSFGGENTATIAAGAVLFSDPVGLGVAPLADLAVSLYLPGEVLKRFSDHRPLCTADQLYLAAGRFHGGKCDSDRQPHQRLVLRLRCRRARQRRHRWHRGTRRFADRRQHLHDGRLLPLARPARAPADGAAARPADGGHERGARRQPHPLRHPRR